MTNYIQYQVIIYVKLYLYYYNAVINYIYIMYILLFLQPTCFRTPNKKNWSQNPNFSSRQIKQEKIRLKQALEIKFMKINKLKYKF